VFLTDIYSIEKNIMIELANKYNFCVIDASEYLKQYPLESLILNKNDRHYNSYAHKLIAEFIFSQITKNSRLLHT
jgi:hypothetical protein